MVNGRRSIAEWVRGTRFGSGATVFLVGFWTGYEKPPRRAVCFWRRFNGTTEYNPSDVVLGVKAYYRKVISPKNPEHQKYLKIQPDGTYFIRDNLGMVSQIELFTGEKCNRRVCRYCHNPLLTNYGKSPVKFITVIGITGAGKTIYLSQILKKMEAYITKGGLSATFKNTGVLNFIENNGVAVNKALPGSTLYSACKRNSAINRSNAI